MIVGDAEQIKTNGDLVFTDPPYDMPADRLARIINRHAVEHIVMLTTMRQLIEFLRITDWDLRFDFVIDNITSKPQRSHHAPHYMHSTGVYLTRHGVSSRFDRRRRMRSDTYKPGHWPSILRAPRQHTNVTGMAKNVAAVTDILGAFDTRHVVDPFAGSGTTGLAAAELGINCTLIELDRKIAEESFSLLRMVCADVVLTSC